MELSRVKIREQILLMGITEASNIYVKQDYVLGNTNYEIVVKHKAGNRLVALLIATFWIASPLLEPRNENSFNSKIGHNFNWKRLCLQPNSLSRL